MLDRNLRLAAQVGLRGTPLLIAGDGRVSEGAKRAAELDAWLNAGEQPASRRQAISNRGGNTMSPIRSLATDRCATGLPHRRCRLSALALAGCASMAGVGGSAEFGCKAPVGVQCDSVSGNYYNALQQNLPSQQKSAPASAGRAGRTDAHGSARRESARVRRRIRRNDASFRNPP